MCLTFGSDESDVWTKNAVNRTGNSGSSASPRGHAEISGAYISRVGARSARLEKKGSLSRDEPRMKYQPQYLDGAQATHSVKKEGLRQKVVHEFIDFFGIFLYLAFFFCAVSTYRMLLQSDFRDSYVDYSFAVINAFVIAKVILIGEYTHLGKRLENQPLLASSIYKAVLFGLLTFAFHVVEEAIKKVFHGEGVASAFLDIHLKVLLARSIVVFCTFLPLFAFRELRRVLGETRFNDLFFRHAKR